VAEGVAGHALIDACVARSILDDTFTYARVQMMPTPEVSRVLVA
jgi:hypothetical protein